MNEMPPRITFWGVLAGVLATAWCALLLINPGAAIAAVFAAIGIPAAGAWVLRKLGKG